MMRLSQVRGVRRGIVAAVMLLVVAPQVQAQRAWSAELTPEVDGATGSGFAFFSLTGSMLSISANWTGLSGTTTVAHIHCCTAAPGTGTVGVAVTPGTLPGFPVGVTSGTYDEVIDLDDPASFTATFVTNFGGGTIAGAQQALFNGFDNGAAYFNIHSTDFPPGEIRGFLVAVPEPTTVVMLAFGMVAPAVPAARRRIKA